MSCLLLAQQQQGNSSSLSTNQQEEEVEDPCNVTIEPHILRLLRLIQYPNPKRGRCGSTRNNGPNDDRNEYADHAARMLGQVTSRSSPLVLWDVLGRLRHMLLHSPLWSTRQCVALAMTLVSSHLPGKDQEEFISGITTSDGGKEEDTTPLLWLTVSDLAQSKPSSDSTPTNGDRIALDVVLRKGTILLSRMESSYCTSQDDEDHYQKLHTIEDSILNTLDTKAIHTSSSATSQLSSGNKTFMDARLQYQRSVMARRLGFAQEEEHTMHAALPHTASNDPFTFAQNFVAQELLTHSFLTDFVTQQDIINDTLKGQEEAHDYAKQYHKSRSKRTKKKKTLSQHEAFDEKLAQAVSNNVNNPNEQKKKKKERKAKTKRTTQHQQPETSHDEDYGTVRALLVLEMRSDTHTNGVMLSSKSHARPRALLATDLLYSMFHPNWQTRHGACLGILALCKAWLPTAYNNNNTASSSSSVAFGSWLQDILARSICVLALDRFGDYSDDDKEGGGVVAPVRLAASQLLAFLWYVAPLKTQVQSLRLLHHMIAVSQQCDWEVRHGSMLALYYICSTTTDIPTFLQVNNNSGKDVTNTNHDNYNGNIDRANSASLTRKDPSQGGIFDILLTASRGLVDDSDDVRSVSSRVILQLVRNSSSSVDGNISTSLAHCNSTWQEQIISVCTPPLWIAIQQARSVSSCVTDLLSLLEGFITVNALSVVCNILQSKLADIDGSGKSEDVATVKSKTTRKLTMHEIEQFASQSSIFNVICQILEKLIEFLDYEYISCRISSLDVLAKVMEPIYGLTNSLVQGSKNCHGFHDDDESKLSPSVALPLVSITCHLLIKIYNSFWETNCYIDSDTKYQKLFHNARDRCWGALMKAIAEYSSNFHLSLLPAFTELISKTYATLILSYFGILLITPQPSPPRGGSSVITVPSRIGLLEKEQNYILRRKLLEDEVSYEHQIVGASALADISAKLLERYTIIENGRLVQLLAKNVLHLFLHVMLESPWQDLFEAGILLYTATATASRNNETMINFLDEHDSIMGPKAQNFIDMLDQEVPFCFYITQKSPVGAPQTVCNSTRTAFCDETLVAALQSVLFQRIFNDSDINNRQSIVKLAHGVTNVWRRLFVDNAQGISFAIDHSAVAADLNLARLRGEISCAIIPRFVNYMPTQLRLVTQSLMVCLQRDLSLPLQNAALQSLADLVLILSNRVSITVVDNIQQRHSLCKEVFVTICALVYSSIPLKTDEDTESVDEKKMSVGIMISRLLSGVSSPESLISFFLTSELNPLIHVEGDIDARIVKERLYFLKVISESIHTAPSMIDMLALKLLVPVSLIACNSPSVYSRQLATASVTNFCAAKSSKCVPIIVPIIFDSLRAEDDDARRFGGARLLHAVVESLGTQICPFVKCFLPAVMSTLNDPIDVCAKAAASTFALLVRAAPLVIDDRMGVVSDGKSDPSQVSLSIDTCIVDGLPHFFERDDESSGKVVDHLIHGKPLPSYSLPSTLNASMKGVQLRSYQQEGISWIRFLASVNLNGVLADDMGLGKTIQALVAVGASYCSNEEKEILPSLIVCPSTIVGHWVGEINRFFSFDIFKTWAYAGSAKKRQEKYENKLLDRNIVVTSYAVLRNDVEWLSSQRWNYVVLDEGHLLKNPKTATAKAARKLKCRHKLLLSGTPVQNRCQEIWAIFDFLMPNFLGTESKFFNYFAKPIVNGQLPGASAEEVALSHNRLKQLHQQVLPFILRRGKSQVLKELPEKVVTNFFCDLSREQVMMYQMLTSKISTKITEEHIRKRPKRTIVTVDDVKPKELSVLRCIMLLRLLCTHPKLVVSSMHSRDVYDSSIVEENQMIQGAISDTFSTTSLDRLTCSGKLVALNELLRNASVYGRDITGADNDVSCLYVENDLNYSQDDSSFLPYDLDGEANKCYSKCLIFAQFSRSLDVVEKCLFAPHMPSLRYLRLDGNVSLERRTEIVNQFNSDESIRVLLLTTKAGGLGLNLSAAQLVIMLESDWNPHADLQAIDRAHRIGQQGTLQVYRLITRGTVEEKIMKLQDQKISMSEAIVNTDNSSLFSMGTDRLLDLFTFHSPEIDEATEFSNHRLLEDFELDQEWLDEEYAALKSISKI